MVGVNRILSSSSGVERIDLFGTDRLRDDFEWNYSSSLLMTPPQTWTRLSSIYLRSITSNTASIFLRTLADSAIEDIHITITEPDIVAVVPPIPIVLLVQAPRPTATLEKLRSLAVESRIPHLPPVFNAITVPTLEKLSVELYGSEDTEEWSTAAALRTSLAALWERCTCPPQTVDSTSLHLRRPFFHWTRCTLSANIHTDRIPRAGVPAWLGVAADTLVSACIDRRSDDQDRGRDHRIA